MAKMTPEDLKKRTKKFAIDILRFSATLPNSPEGRAVRNQIVRSGTSIGANYRAACRARSRKEFVAKLGTVEEETDETMYWLEISAEAELATRELAAPLWKESRELLAITVASIRSARPSKTPKSKTTNPQSEIRNPQSPRGSR